MSFNCVQGTPRERRETNTLYSVVLTWQSITSLNEMRFPGDTSNGKGKGGLDTDWTELQGLARPRERRSAQRGDGGLTTPFPSNARQDRCCTCPLWQKQRDSYLRTWWPLAKLLKFINAAVGCRFFSFQWYSCGQLFWPHETRTVGYVNWRPDLKLILPMSSFNVSPVTALRAAWFRIAKKPQNKIETKNHHHHHQKTPTEKPWYM